MERIGNITVAEGKVLADVTSLLSGVHSIAGKIPESAAEGVALLSQLRDLGYEDLNQIQHEYLILVAAKWLIDNKAVTSNVEWYWNPRQSGGAEEPDLRAQDNSRILVSAEITTSRRPIGTIYERMKSTLEKLNKCEGEKYYFVHTESMSKKADSVVTSNAWAVTVVCLPHVAGEL